MRSNATVGPPINLLNYEVDSFTISGYRRFEESDPQLKEIQRRWEQSLREAVRALPSVTFERGSRPPDAPQES
jgi:putative proteasome-type protease